MKTTQTTYILWGQHPAYASGLLIKLMRGTERECNGAYDRYKREGWNKLQIRAKGWQP